MADSWADGGRSLRHFAEWVLPEGADIPDHLQANDEFNYYCNDYNLTAEPSTSQNGLLDTFFTPDDCLFDWTFPKYDASQQHGSIIASELAPGLLIGASSSQTVPHPITTESAIGMSTPLYKEVAHPAAIVSRWDLDSNWYVSDRGFLGIDATNIPNESSGADSYVSSEDSLTAHPATGQHQASLSILQNLSRNYQCGTCGMRFDYEWGRKEHCRTSEHHQHGCTVLDCTFATDKDDWLKEHLRVAHTELHVCNQCQQQFRGTSSLGKHATKTGHASFLCIEKNCGKAFSRFDVFKRHQDTHRTNVQRFPCQHCRRYRGADGFKRKDHLIQHLRNYHHIGVDDTSSSTNRSQSCPHEGCPSWRSEDKQRADPAFQKRSDYVAHMRKVHKESEFPCTESGCNRSGPKGYFRLRDLQKHKLKEHNIPIE